MQAWRTDGLSRIGGGKIYETVTRPACGGVHLINPSTGKVLGAEAALSARR